MPLWRLVGLRHLSIGGRVSELGVRFVVARPWARHSEPTEEELRRALSDIADALPLDPFAATVLKPLAIRVEGAPVRYVMTGVLAGEPDVARERVLDVLRALHFQPGRHGPVDDFLGWHATAVRGPIVVTAAVGAYADDDESPFGRLIGATYVQLTAG